MRRTITLERAFGQLLSPTTPRNVCGSCRLRNEIHPRRQLQTSAAQSAGLNLRERLGFGSKKKQETEDAAVAELDQESEKYTPRLYSKGWTMSPKEDRLPEGWAKTPDEDSGYIVATSVKDLERVGSDKWVDSQYDDKGEYKGWSRIKRQSNMSYEDAKRHVLASAKEVISPEQHKDLQDKQVAFKLSDIATKFAIVKEVRWRTKIQIPDITMNRADTLKDFVQAILTKPKSKKLSTDLLANEKIMQSGNVLVRGRRQTPIHKDRAVGRWKLIEQELANRGLPITGHGPKAKRGFEEE